MSNKILVISLGGSLIYPKELNLNFLKNFRKLIFKILKNHQKIIIVTGGGKIGREYQKTARQISLVSTSQLDWLGIASTRLNAELIRVIFSAQAYEKVVVNPLEKIKTPQKIIVASGFKPGSSSDKVAVLLAKNFKAQTVLNLTNIDYVYGKDIRKYKDAKPLKVLSWSDYLKIVGRKWNPGDNFPFDPVASSLAKKWHLKVVILKGTNLKNLSHCLAGRKFKGTVIGR